MAAVFGADDADQIQFKDATVNMGSATPNRALIAVCVTDVVEMINCTAVCAGLC
jgi:hypothetical protein